MRIITNKTIYASGGSILDTQPIRKRYKLEDGAVGINRG